MAQSFLQVISETFEVLNFVSEQRFFLLEGVHHLVHFIESFLISLFEISQDLGVVLLFGFQFVLKCSHSVQQLSADVLALAEFGDGAIVGGLESGELGFVILLDSAHLGHHLVDVCPGTLGLGADVLDLDLRLLGPDEGVLHLCLEGDDLVLGLHHPHPVLLALSLGGLHELLDEAELLA